MTIRLRLALVGVLALIVVVVVVVVVVVSDGDKVPHTDVACTTDTTAEAIHRENSSIGLAAVGTRGPFRVVDNEIQCRLRRALMTLDDLPRGWRKVEGVSDHVPRLNVLAACGMEYQSVRDGVVAAFEPETEGALGGAWHQVIALEPGDAGRLMAAIRRSCGNGQDGSSIGSKIIGEPELGDEAIEVEARIDRTSEPALIERLVLVRSGDVISSVSVSPPESLGLTPLSTRMAGRLVEIGALPEGLVFRGEGCVLPGERSSSDERLVRVLLRQAEVPPGWVENPPESCAFVGLTSACDETPSGAGPVAHAAIGFAGGTRQALQLIEAFEGAASAEVWDRIEEALSSGRRECQVTYEGLSFQWAFERANNVFGDEALAYTAHTETRTDGKAIVFVVVLREADAISWIALRYSGLAANILPVDFLSGEVAPFVAAAREKLKRLDK